MASINVSVPGLFGGVSQQLPALRHPTHGELQENGISSLVDGLAKRPGTQFVLQEDLTTLYSSGVDDGTVQQRLFTHLIDYSPTEKYLLVMGNDFIRVNNLLTGALCTVNYGTGVVASGYRNPGAGNYADDTFRAVSLADYTIVLNNKVTVTASTTDTFENPLNVAYFVVTKALNGVDYTIGVNGTSFTHTAAETGVVTTGGVASALATGLGTALGAGWTVATLTDSQSVVKVTKASGAVTSVLAKDSYGNTAVYCMSDGVPAYSSLPAKFETGYTVRIIQAADTVGDDYFVKWTGAAWVETKEPLTTTKDTLDKATMPHKLVRTALNTFTFDYIPDWTLRLVGDDNTNPMPSFVGQKIADIFFYRNRLGVASADSVTLSSAGRYFQFFAETARTVLDSDPIDLSANADTAISFTSTVPFNEDMLVLSAKSQWILTGGDVMSPKTARLLQATAFDSSSSAKPAALGNRAVFASPKETHAALSFYQTNALTGLKEIDDITAHVPRYIPKAVRCIAPYGSEKKVAVAPYSENALYLFEYSETNGKFDQRAWSKWVFPNGAESQNYVCGLHWLDGALYVVLVRRDKKPGGAVKWLNVVEKVTFLPAVSETVGGTTLTFSPRLDTRKSVAYSYDVNTDTTTVTLPWRRETNAGRVKVLAVISGRTDPLDVTAKLSAPTVSDVNHTTTYTIDGPLPNCVGLVAGYTYDFKYRFTEVILRDKDGVPILDHRVRLRRMSLHYRNTGFFKVLVTPYLRDAYVYPLNGRFVGDPGAGLASAPVSSGNFSVALGGRPRGLTVDLFSDSYYPASIPYAEYVAEVIPMSQR